MFMACYQSALKLFVLILGICNYVLRIIINIDGIRIPFPSVYPSLSPVLIGHGLMGVLMHPPHYLHSLVFSFTPGSVDLEKAC